MVSGLSRGSHSEEMSTAETLKQLKAVKPLQAGLAREDLVQRLKVRVFSDRSFIHSSIHLFIHLFISH